MGYRFVEISTPRFERDGIRHMAFFSDALGHRGEVTLFVPPQAKGRSDVPLVMLLHGVYATHFSWAFNGGAHFTAQEMITAGQIPPMILAMPSDGLWGEGSGYIPHADADYEAWIVDDTLSCVIDQMECLSTASPVFIAGLSMGGYGALRLGAKFPHLFAGISGHSSITDIRQMAVFIETPPPMPADTPEEHLAAVYWMRHNRAQLPPLRFDCGVDDKLIEHNRELHRALEADCIPHLFVEYPGTHSWTYWEEHLRDTLDFFTGIAAP